MRSQYRRISSLFSESCGNCRRADMKDRQVYVTDLESEDQAAPLPGSIVGCVGRATKVHVNERHRGRAAVVDCRHR